MQEQLRGFDMADHQQERVRYLESVKASGSTNTAGERMDYVEMHNEQLMRDAKQQGRQGNVFFGEDGKIVIKSEIEKKKWLQGEDRKEEREAAKTEDRERGERKPTIQTKASQNRSGKPNQIL